MPGLSFSNQNQPRRPGGWIIPVVLIVVSAVLITVSVRVDNGGVIGTIRNGVHAVVAPAQSAVSGISKPFKALGSIGGGESISEEDAAALKEENQQLKVLVSQLEEYRQQDQRLTALMSLSDTYALETVSGRITTVSSGWDKVATVNVGSDAGVRAGMGVISSCGLYGQVESVTANTAKVRLVTDADSKVSAMVQGTRGTGTVSGSYDGTLTMEYVSAESSVGEGDIIITSGAGGSYPQGIIIGKVHTVELDSSKLYYRLTLDPISNIKSCVEVLILTGNEDSTKSLVDEKLIESITAPAVNSAAGEGSSAKSSEGNEGSSQKAEGDSAQKSGDSNSSKSSSKSGSSSSKSNSKSTEKSSSKSSSTSSKKSSSSEGE